MDNQDAKPRGAWILPAAALVAAAGLLILFGMNRMEEHAAERVMRERGDTVLNALAAGIRAQTRRGRYRSEQLDAIFSELAQAPGIVGLELRSAHGDVIAEGGEKVALPILVPGYPVWEGQHLIMAREARFAPEPPDPFRWGRSGPWGRGGDRWWDGKGPREGFGPPWSGRREMTAPESEGEGAPEDEKPTPKSPRPDGRGAKKPGVPEVGTPWDTGTYILAVVLDTRPMAEEIARARVRFVLSASIGLLALTSGVAALLARNRQRRLQTELLLATERAAQSEKLARMGAGLAHETKNPLGVVRGLAQGIASNTSASAETKQAARDIVDEADRTVGQINGFLAMARPKDPDLRPIALDAFFEQFGPLLEAETAGADVSITWAGNGVRILADEDLLRRALLNLTINAARACHGKGQIQIEARQDTGVAAITVRDTGCGIAPEDLPHVTEPYFTRFEGGCGLGLSIVEQTARVHGWTLDIASHPGEGTQITLRGQNTVG